MGGYSSSSLAQGVINTELFKAGNLYEFSFSNESTAVQSGGYFSVIASGSSDAFSPRAFNTGPIGTGKDQLLRSVSVNPTDQSPIGMGKPLATTTNGKGIGCEMEVIFTGGLGSSTMTYCRATEGGKGYAIGDTLTVPAVALNKASGASGTTDLVFRLTRNDIIARFDGDSMANLSGTIFNFGSIFNSSHVWNRNATNIVSGSSLIQNKGKWSIAIPSTFFKGETLVWKPDNNIGPGAITYKATAHVGLKITG
jgi:hypothetical protein